MQVLERRARLNNGSNGSGIKGQQKTLINKLLSIAEGDFIGHSFPNFPKISKEYKQVKHLNHTEWDTLYRQIFDLGELVFEKHSFGTVQDSYNEQKLLVFLEGELQDNTKYIIVGNKLYMTTTPPASNSLEVVRFI